MPVLSTGRRGRRRVLNAIAWLTLAGLLALVLGTLPATAAADAKRCDGKADVSLPLPAGDDTGQFLVGDEQFDLRLTETQSADNRKITIPAYPSTEPPANLNASIDAGLTSIEGHNIDEVITVAEVTRIGNGATPMKIRVCVEFDPHQVPDLRPGRYRGAVVLSADNYQDAVIPIVVTFRAPPSEGLRMAAAGVVLGLIVKMLTELGSGRRSRTGASGQGLRSYVFQWSFPLAIILGVLAGWLGFVEMYESNPTWGVGGGTDSIKLFAACFGFQMGSIGGADMTKRLTG